MKVVTGRRRARCLILVRIRSHEPQVADISLADSASDTDYGPRGVVLGGESSEDGELGPRGVELDQLMVAAAPAEGGEVDEAQPLLEQAVNYQPWALHAWCRPHSDVERSLALCLRMPDAPHLAASANDRVTQGIGIVFGAEPRKSASAGAEATLWGWIAGRGERLLLKLPPPHLRHVEWWVPVGLAASPNLSPRG